MPCRGLSTDRKAAFRSYFSEVGNLRAHFSTAPMLCLTATATKTTQVKIKELLALKDPLVLELPPDRPNIRLYINRVQPGPSCLDWLVEELCTKTVNCPKTIIYCRSFKDCSEVYLHFLYKLGKQSPNLNCRLFDMVHSKTSKEVKVHVLDSLMEPEAALRIVIATKVIGLGLDVECQRVVHYGPPTTMDDYLQQIGRAGRDGSQTHAVMVYSGKHLRNVQASVLDLVKNPETQCLRTICLKEFTSDKSTFSQVKHLCCNVCADNCTCGHCSDGQNSYEKYIANETEKEDEEEEEEEFQRHIEADDLAMLKVELIQLAEELNRNARSTMLVYMQPEITHGLSPTSLQRIIEQAPHIFCPEDVIDKCQIAHYSTVVKVVSIFSDIFGDVNTDFSIDEDMLA